MHYNNDTQLAFNLFIFDLKSNKKYLEICYRYLLIDKDYRTGEETYGYNDIIKDKWCCSFRIRWILDLIKRMD